MSDDNAYAYTVDASARQQQPCVQVLVNGTSIKFMIDSGATINILDESAFSQLKTSPTLMRARNKLYAYGSKSPINVIRTFSAAVESKRKITEALIFVVRGDGGSLLSFNTASDLGFIKININLIGSPESTTIDALSKQHHKLFNGVDKVRNFQVRLHINKNIKPSAVVGRDYSYLISLIN